MDKKQFWKILDKLDWSKEGDDEKVLDPVVIFLSKLSDEEIFRFEDIMSELLFDIDGAEWALDIYKDIDQVSDDDFLYTRCVALINGEDYYYKIKNRIEKVDPDLEFESLLELPERAWKKKYKSEGKRYTHISAISYETGSNVENW